MEKIYKNLSSEKNKEFAQLLADQFSQTKIEEGKLTSGTVTKITDKLVFIYIKGCKAEGTIDVNELKLLKEFDGLKVGSTLKVMLEKLENKFGDIVISREKALRFTNFEKLKKAFEKEEIVEGKIISKIKGGFVVDVMNTLAFLPGSQIDLKPMKNIDHLFKTDQKFLIIKVDELRQNICVSRRAILEKTRNQHKEQILSKFKVGDIIEGSVKGMTPYGVFFDLDGFDSLTHINEISWSRIGHPEELFSIGQKQKLKIISIDNESKKISTSIKALTPDPFETKVNNYKVGKTYEAIVKKITEYGIFFSLEDGLEGLCHSSEISHIKKNVSPKKLFSISQKVKIKIKEIDKEKRRISLSYKDTVENPWEKFKKEYPEGSTVKAKIKNITEFALFVKINNFELDGMVHYKDLTYEEKSDDLKKFNNNDEISAQVLEINQEKEKLRLGLKQLLPDPIVDYFKEKKEKQVLTVIVKETLENGIKVAPDGYLGSPFLIKKAQIAVDKEDQRVSRFNKGDKIDCMVQELDLSSRKVSLSIKMLEAESNKEAIKKYGSVDSGKSLPFANLSGVLKKKISSALGKKLKKKNKKEK